MRAPILVASVLPADFSELGRQVKQLEKASVDRIQWDVMDGRFVPDLTFGPDVIAANRRHVSLGFEVHLMVDDPEPMLPRWVEAGCEIVIVHAEATRHLLDTLSAIRDLGARAGVALNPATPLEGVTNVLHLTDLLLVMTVDPGFGGQQYLAAMDPTAPSADARHSTHLTPGPKPSPAPTSTRRTTGSATTESTPPASSPCATTAGSTTSDYPNAAAAPTSSC
jgi:ribulose-phosphate 3-epimerase